jgi:hypothetical protein
MLTGLPALQENQGRSCASLLNSPSLVGIGFGLTAAAEKEYGCGEETVATGKARKEDHS